MNMWRLPAASVAEPRKKCSAWDEPSRLPVRRSVEAISDSVFLYPSLSIMVDLHEKEVGLWVRRWGKDGDTFERID